MERDRSLRARLTHALLYVLPPTLVVAAVKLPAYVATDKLDPSWQGALAVLFRLRAQAGVDYVFTSGPLGPFLHTTYDRPMFWAEYAWEIAVGLLSVCLLLRVARRHASPAVRLALLALVLVFLIQVEDFVYVCMVVSALLLFDRPREPPAACAAALVYLALMALVKFTFLVLALALVTIVAVHALAARLPWRALAIAGSFFGLYLAGWIATGQSPANLPEYFAGSFEISAGFSAAMGHAGSSFELTLAVALLAIHLGVLPALAGRPALRGAAIAGLAVIAAAELLAFKHGFARHNMHALRFFRYALVVPFLLPLVAPSPRWQRGAARGLLVASVALAVVGTLTVLVRITSPTYAALYAPRVVKSGIVGLFRPDLVRDRLESKLADARSEFALPAIRAHVGTGSVDLFSSGQGVVFLNDLSWNPRPVFQSYTAYTQPLMQMNARHFEGPEAPDHVIFRLEPLDGRPLTHEDSTALRNILRAYRPVLNERSYLLLDRLEPSTLPAADAGREVLRRSIAWNEEVDVGRLPGAYHTISLEIRPGLRGRLQNALLRLPEVYLELRLSDGETRRYRVVPDMAREAFLLNPHCDDQLELLGLYAGEPGRRVASLRLLAEAGAEGAFRAQIGLVIRGYDRLTGVRLDPAELDALRGPGGALR